MSVRVSPIDRIGVEIDEVLNSGRPITEILEEVARLGAQLILQSTVEAEVTEWLGRARYQRGERRRQGWRNGFSQVTIKTTAGPVRLSRPKLRGATEAFASRLLGKGVTRSNALESLVIAGYVRGLSDRDVEAALSEALGPEASISKSTVSRVCQTLRSEFEAFAARDLSDVELDYLYLDGSNFKMHPNSRRPEPILAAWGITTSGAKTLVGLASGSAESYPAWLEFFRDLKARGLQAPLLGVTDGAPGLIGAFDEVFAGTARQRCVIHKARNVLAKVTKADQETVKAEFWSIFDDIEEPSGPAAVAEATRRAQLFADKWQSSYPAAVDIVTGDLEALTVHLWFPPEHWKRIRHTNLIERTFGETRRRTKVIGRFPGEQSCISLVWAVLDRASARWRGLIHNKSTQQLLAHYRTHGLTQPRSEEEPINQAA